MVVPSAVVEGVGVADRFALLELHARCAAAIDDGDAEAWAACFTPDGVLRTSRPSHVESRAGLAAFGSDWYARTGGQPRHMTWQHRYEARGDEVAGTCYAALLRTAAAQVEIVFTAVYRDRYVRADDGWLIAERSVEIDRG